MDYQRQRTVRSRRTPARTWAVLAVAAVASAAVLAIGAPAGAEPPVVVRLAASRTADGIEPALLPLAIRRQDLSRLPIPLTAAPTPTPSATPTPTATPTATATPTPTEVVCGPLAERLRISAVDVSPLRVELRTGQGQWNAFNPVMLDPTDNGWSRVAWTDGSGMVRVTTLDDSDERVGDDWPVRRGEVRGLVAHSDGAALLIADEPFMYFARLDANGEMALAKTLVGEDPQTQEGSQWIDDWGHEGRLIWTGEEYGAYFGHTQYFGSRGKHQGDLFWLLDESGERRDGGWDWGCSHSLDLRLAHNGARFGPICLSDCYPSKGFHFSRREAEIRPEPSGDCRGGSTARLGGVVPVADGFLATFASHEGRASADIGLVRVSNEAKVGRVTWLTASSNDEQAPHLVPYGDAFLAAWQTEQSAVAAVVAADGSVIEAPAAIQASFAARDDFAAYPNGDAGWAHAWGDMTKLRIVRVKYCEP